MRKSGCSKQKPRAQWKLKNGDISLSQRCLKMGASTADCIWRRAEPIPELLNPGRSTNLEYRLLGKSGLRVSEASLGTMTFGDEWGWGSPKDEAHKVYETYREAGGNFIDTANFYTGGTSEKFVGEFIKSHRLKASSFFRCGGSSTSSILRWRRKLALINCLRSRACVAASFWAA